MIQPNWKESLVKLETLSKESVDVTNYLLARISDDFQEVREKAISLFSQIFPLDINYSHVSLTLSNNIEDSFY